MVLQAVSARPPEWTLIWRNSFSKARENLALSAICPCEQPFFMAVSTDSVRASRLPALLSAAFGLAPQRLRMPRRALPCVAEIRIARYFSRLQAGQSPHQAGREALAWM